MPTQTDVLLTGDLGFQGQRIQADRDGFTFDFSDATVHTAVYPDTKNVYPILVHLNGYHDVHILGGTIIRHDDPYTRWGQSYYEGNHNSALELTGDHDGQVLIDGLRAHNTHDGIVIGDGETLAAKDVTIRHVYMTHIRDDAIENDGMQDLVIEDSLLDGVYSGFSAVNPSSKKFPSDSVVTIRDTLVRMENMPGDPSQPATSDGWGHGPVFKWWDGRAPDLVLQNNIFVVEDPNALGTKDFGGKIIHSEGNVVIWMGQGKFPDTLPAGFTLIAGNDTVFQEARDAWLARHGYDPKGSLRDNLHAPVLDGAKPAPEPEPAPEPTPSPNVGLVAKWLLDADLDGNQQKVVIDHDASLELDQGTVALTFTPDRVSNNQGLLSKDSLGQDDGGGLAIWLMKDQVVALLESESWTYKLSSKPGVVKAGVESKVAVAFGDEGFRLYVDGDLVDQHQYSGGIAQNHEQIVVGANDWKSNDGRADNLSNFFQGTISELSVYNEEFDSDLGSAADVFVA